VDVTKRASPPTTADDGQNSSVESEAGPWPASMAPVQAVAAPGPDQPFRSVGFTISTTGYAIARRFRELLAPLGLEPREFALLRAVAASEGVSQQAIGERMKVAPSRMVAFVDALEQRGLLERRQNPADRRARALFLTSDGRRVLKRAFAVAAEHERLICGDLGAQEREQLLDLLARVGAQLGIPPGVHSGMGHSALSDE
jgi:DNA-binding MarR family transcriptional regulator